MEQNKQPPAMLRRQSLPEELLSSAQNRTFPQGSFEGEYGVSAHGGSRIVDNVGFSGDTMFKRSEHTRFGKRSKRKSQSLYESLGQDAKNLSLPKEQLVSLENFPVVPRVQSAQQGGASFAQLNQTKTEKQQEDSDYDFLLQQQQQLVLNTPESISESRKEQQGELSDRMKIPSTLVEGQISLHGSYENNFPSRKTEYHSEDFYQNLHQNFIQPNLHQGQYPTDNFAVNAMSNFPFQGMPHPFPINPLNNFQHPIPRGLHPYGQIQIPASTDISLLGQPKSEAKRRRSRVPSSQYRGVSRCGKDNKFQARIRVQGKVKYLGRFKNEVEAAKCYDKYAIEYLGVNAQTNFPLPRPTGSSN